MNLLKTILTRIIDWIIPENSKVQSLLKMEAYEMQVLLPQSPTRLGNITVLFDYQNKQVKNLVKAIKYKNNVSLKKRIAGYLYEEIMSLSEDISLFDGAPPVIIPMPMSKIEKRKRGFNQCEELMREIEKLSNKELEVEYDLLQKVRETKRQTELNKEERLENVKNSMEVSPQNSSVIKNRVIIIVDDVYTTLATFYEAERALLASGAKRVLGIFIAH